MSKICCGELERFIAQGYKHPFSCKDGRWIVVFNKRKSNGAHNEKEYKKVVLKFCPFCGCNLEQAGCAED